MARARMFARLDSQFVQLQSYAERAGCALACSFSTSDEFEAAVIRAKRAAGFYGPRRNLRRALWAGLVGGACGLLVGLVLLS
jgi:hypothetical protein